MSGASPEVAPDGPRVRRLSAHLVAGLVTATGPAAVAALWLWLVPASCDLRGDPSTYRWACLLPGLLLTLSAVVAVMLVAAAVLSRRLARYIGASWIATGLFMGAVVQIVLVGGYMGTLDLAYRGAFLNEIPYIPQPFVAGAVTGAVHAGTLRFLLGRQSG